MRRPSARTINTVIIVASLVALVGVAAHTGALQSIWKTRSAVGAEPPRLTTQYQAVVLDVGQVYFGRISGLGTQYPVLSDVYYIQRQIDPKTKQVKNVLLKLSSQWHGPTEMTINARHIVAVEPVGANSAVDQLIKKAQSQRP